MNTRALILVFIAVLSWVAQCCAADAPGSFPFSIQGGRFLLNGAPAFLHLIGYQPLEPGQAIDGGIRAARIQDDLRRFQAYRGGTDPILLRVYAQPTSRFPQRMPKSFYDGVRELGFWIVRDIFFPDNFEARDAIPQGRAAVDAVINEVAAAGALDRIFAWEIGNEFRALSPEANAALESFICAMRDHLKRRMAEPGRERFSNWFTWASWVQNDPLRTVGNRVLPACLDFAAYNAYSYDPERGRDHQAGPVTGTPYAGYLTALKQAYPNLPLIISETGLADNPSPAPGHEKLFPGYPVYRYGGLTPDQVAEGLADRYWDARLTGAVAGVGVFEWNNEWHKRGDPSSHADHPEEHFGLVRFSGPQLEARFKLQQETVRSLFSMRFSPDAPPLQLSSEVDSLSSTGRTQIRATLPDGLKRPVRWRWEASRGRVVGESDTVEFHAGGRALGAALVTAVVVDGENQVRTGSLFLPIRPDGPPRVQILTLGEGPNTEARASGRVENVDLDQHKLVVFVQTDRNYVQPYADMRSIWIGPDGYWWTPVDNRFQGRLMAWLVPKSYHPPLTLPVNATPPGALTSANFGSANDRDNDLLPDRWEPKLAQDRYDDPDADGATNLEEWLAGTDPMKADNDQDQDKLPDTWERRFFGTLLYSATDDPDRDGLDNLREFEAALHPSRSAADRDRDGLPDLWELHWFGNLEAQPNHDAGGDGLTNLDAYELGHAPSRGVPKLKIELLQTRELSLRWPASAGSFWLEMSGALGGPASWSRVPQSPFVQGDQNVLNLNPGRSAEFFRLRRP